jgi:hypothetical protein
VKPVGKPDAGNRHVRFDERGEETERLCGNAPLLDSTTSTGIACRYSAFESEINVLQPFDLQSKEDSLF